MQSYYIKTKAFYDSFGDEQPSQPYSYTYGDRPTFEFCFLPGEIADGDTLVFAVDNDMVFYDSTPSNLLHSASCMVVVRHDVTAEEATAGKVQMRIETRTVKFRDVVNGKVRPVDVISGLYRRRGSDDDINYVLLAKGRAMANGIIADYNALPEPVTTADEFYSKTETDSMLDAKADKADLVAHTDDATIHVTQQEKTEWSNKADRNDIGNATVTITQDGETKGSFSVNASENVTIDLTGGAQADWDETDTSSPSYIQHKPSVYTQTETNSLLDDKADKATTYTKTETDGLLDDKADKTSVYTKNETDGLLNEKANVATTYTKDETNSLLDGKADKATTIDGYGITDAYTKTEIDAKPFATKDELSTGLEGKSDINHLHTGKYVPLTEEGHIPGSYFLRGSLSIGGNLSTNGFVNATTGFKLKNVSLDDIYAAKSHTHAMGDITGLPASGGTAGQVLTKTETGSEWADAPSSSWGSISGDLANQTDLVAAMARKQDSELAIESASGTTLTVLPGKAYNWTLSGNGTLSLGDGWEAGSLSDSVVLLSPGSYSVSCSGNITMVDPLQAGKMNLCVVRWLGDRARLYVVDSESPGTITAQPVTASGTVGTAMSVNLADYVTVSTGANASYAMASGSSLPSGLSLSSEGVLSGTPEAESAEALTVDVTAAGCTPTTLALTMAITAASTP